MRKAIASILFALSLLGCEPSEVSPAFPEAHQVNRLFLSGGEVVTDHSKIAELLAQLGRINDGWHYTRHTYPSPQAQIVFDGTSGQAGCRLDIGPNWIGSDCGVELKSNWPLLVTVSREQALFFRDFVGGTWQVK